VIEAENVRPVLVAGRYTLSPSSMSALGQKQTSADVGVMSALPPKADIIRCGGDPCSAPMSDLGLCDSLKIAFGEDVFNLRPLAWFDWQREPKYQIRAELYRLVW
jgi:hypothetical protein